MRELEKILEEIEEGTHTFELLGRDVDFVAIDWVRDVIRKHMNDGGFRWRIGCRKKQEHISSML